MSKYAKINYIDTVNGSGIRVSIFFSGCNFHCKNCFNSELWDFNYGIPFTEETINKIIELLAPDYIKGLSILGGEPFHNYDAVIKLIKKVKEIYPNKDIWIWTGYKFDDIPEECKDILSFADVIVDGRYEEDKRDLSIAFRGSTNQRIWRKSTNEFNDTVWRYDRE